MGISKLAELIRSDAPNAISYKKTGDYSGKVIALDTSIILSQFRSAVPQLGKLSHLTGLFFRTLHFLEHDIKPVFVFDGTPPAQKKNEVSMQAAESLMTSDPVLFSTDSPHIQDCKRILQLLGVPCIQAPGDGEAFCAQLVKEGKVHAVASEDMDTMPFGSELLIRQFDAKKEGDVMEYSLSKLLDILQLTHKEFVDLCILLGCDYCEKIQGLGPRRALKLIQQYKTIEDVVLHVNRKTHPIPVSWKYQEARRLFLETQQSDQPDLIWTEPNEEELVHFLCEEKHINVSRVRGRMQKFHKMLQERRKEREENSKQARMEDFFRVTRRRQVRLYYQQ
uniref:Zgc:110269 n=1 Tax=Scleropages formosus TaxID=113540 RepID=A0A8C9RI17_SCLFO